ncbi:hypothetical protein [Mesorhizobium sp. M6A.T.Ce.TU.016.01.1.1]|uniref:hypothetical protein n=1 Tax=Mesorhizobium sp. M6A.T.Ce.TU.016.01.1.1 TaxID=2496783 RepID=UPI000FCCCABC|nr:hypothetical protein [Mesorhizobium sp. M6A.T.Ce.TU.016.01.1.1]RUU32406.1 hypothetical protein EOC94_02805 [Mesorhizobium sp. M6A.T.Ce.TU.016.01.1.1]
MSVYEVEKFCHRLTIEPYHRAEALRDLPGTLSRFDLSSAERNAILAGDVAFLLTLGVHPMLLVRLSQSGIAGLTEALYSERIRRVTESCL